MQGKSHEIRIGHRSPAASICELITPALFTKECQGYFLIFFYRPFKQELISLASHLPVTCLLVLWLCLTHPCAVMLSSATGPAPPLRPNLWLARFPPMEAAATETWVPDVHSSCTTPLNHPMGSNLCTPLAQWPSPQNL